MLKKIGLFSILIMVAATVVAQKTNQITSFDQLMANLKTGNNINAVLHYAKCNLFVDGEKQEKTIDAIGGMPIDVYEYFAEQAVHNEHAFISTSQSKLIQNPIGEGYVYNYVKLKIYDNNTVEVFAKYLDPHSYKESMSEKFKGKINNGTNEEGIYLFKH